MDIIRGCAEILLRKIPYYIAEMYTTKEIFCQYAPSVFPQYSDDEIEYIYDLLIKGKKTSIFDIIFDIAETFLTKSNGKVVCNYSEAFRWRDISFKLGQDIFVVAFLAKKDYLYNSKLKDFYWPAIIDINNDKINKKLSDGVTENHFHLNGSGRIFALSFSCIMNYIEGRQKSFNKIKSYLDTSYDTSTDEHISKSLYSQCIIAAAIRLYLFCKIEDETTIFNDVNIDINKLDEFHASEVAELQRLIEFCKYKYGYKENINYFGVCLDYAYSKDMVKASTAFTNDNAVLAGERKFLYSCFYKILNKDFNELEKRYFYKYLIIKNSFRNELVQTNGRIGFRNFYNYQDRKEIFIKGYKQYEYELVRLALNSTIGECNIKSLEARISPKSESRKNAEIIQQYDKIFNSNGEHSYKHFYVFHFLKNIDTDFSTPFIPRHSKHRKDAMKRARAIVAMIENNNSLRKRVRGIDACSNEIGCRPEVFAHSFRYLMNTEFRKDTGLGEQPSPLKLNATYHVGEDFLDVVDGLRAIDEVITYFGFKRGNRLGHAIALGINADDYYKKKKMQLIMTKHDVLDNIVWLIERAASFNITVNRDLYIQLLKIYKLLLKEIYGDEKIETYSYYQAWKLRGDVPEQYLGNTVNRPHFLLDSEKYSLNESISDEIRYNPIYRNLYYRYNYDTDIKIKGHEKYIFKVDNKYINLVKSIQYEMQKYIKGLGIMIESNPSSNYLIGTIDRYEQHPIFTFFDIDGTKHSNMSVSINTDDQGVFETSLQNEYALIALSLEKSKGYSSDKIQSFIDNIRRSGFEQVFK